MQDLGWQGTTSYLHLSILLRIAYGDIACNAVVSDDFIYLYMRVHIHSMSSLNHNFINL